MKQLIIIIIIIINLSGCYNKLPEKTGLEGLPLPSFSLLLPDSTTHYNTKDIPKGTSIILIYFSPLCSFSRGQTEEIIEDIEDLKESQLYFCTHLPFETMRTFYNHYKLSKYSNITCGRDFTKYFSSYFHIKGYPFIAIYGKDKTLKQVIVGQTSVERLKEIIEN